MDFKIKLMTHEQLSLSLCNVIMVNKLFLISIQNIYMDKNIGLQKSTSHFFLPIMSGLVSLIDCFE